MSKIDEMTVCFKRLLELIGEDPSRDGLLDTPVRAAKAFEFLTNGYHLNIKEVIKEAFFNSDYKGMAIIKGIEIFSLCEHHLLPFFGSCHIAYLPSKKVIGLSKTARVVDVFARRLQIQERLTQQIAECIRDETHAEGVGVVIEAQHLCMMMRGVEKMEAKMVTTCLLGKFETDQAIREEFLSQI